MSKVKDLLREYTAPLVDNYGESAYEEVLSSLEQLLPAAFAEDVKPTPRTREEQEQLRRDFMEGKVVLEFDL